MAHQPIDAFFTTFLRGHRMAQGRFQTWILAVLLQLMTHIYIKCFKSSATPPRSEPSFQRLQGMWRPWQDTEWIFFFPHLVLLCEISMPHHTVPSTRFPGETEDTTYRKIIIFQRLEDEVLPSRGCPIGKEWSPTLPCFASGSRLLSHGSSWHPQGVFYFFLHVLSGLPSLFCKTQTNQELQQD